jgi:putative membrane protein
MRDLVLAIVHHILVFGLFGVLFAEFMILRAGMNHVSVERIASIDLWYGLLAAAVIVIGLCRAIFAAKGWAYYSHNAFFWAKLASFAAIGLLSIPPTLAFIRWRRAGVAPGDDAVKAVRLYLHIELTFFVMVLIFAAAMARGYGEF